MAVKIKDFHRPLWKRALRKRRVLRESYPDEDLDGKMMDTEVVVPLKGDGDKRFGQVVIK